jgi:hypothetical protein
MHRSSTAGSGGPGRVLRPWQLFTGESRDSSKVHVMHRSSTAGSGGPGRVLRPWQLFTGESRDSSKVHVMHRSSTAGSGLLAGYCGPGSYSPAKAGTPGGGM